MKVGKLGKELKIDKIIKEIAFFDFYRSSGKRLSLENNSSMLLESSGSEVENRKAEVSFSARDLSFSEIGQLFS